MAKQKAPSPQELYRQRKAREEKERAALLPPGLVNHGNTCFMNSVIQGLIATRYLDLLVHFRPITALPIASHRSPALTNGHRLSPEHDRPWSDALPIADQLVALLHAAWDLQETRKRDCISPRDLLSALGKKYDQYLDFRQQDAHEFLCQLLDAIRTEETDLIKIRSPAQKKSARRSQSRRHDTTPQPPDDGPLSFVDMLFGGRLASILVCQTCKHVSHTYEEFNDLSLSMKPEDYTRERRRDKLKQIAKKIGTAFYGVPQQRSSSVPATPVRDSNLDSPEAKHSPRRRSIDLADVNVPVEHPDLSPVPPVAPRDDTPLQAPPFSIPGTPSVPGTPTDPVHHVPILDIPAPAPPHDSVSFSAPEKANEKEKRDKDESWARIGRRISVSVGLAKRPKPDLKDKRGLTPPKTADAGNSLHPIVPTPVMVDTSGSVSPYPHPEKDSPTSSLGLVNERLQAQLTSVKRSVMPTQRSTNSPSGSSARFPLISRPSSPGIHHKSSKPPRPPKLSTEEAAYLRDILADINPPNVQKPFSIFKQSKELSSTSAFHSQSIFLKVNQINRIEECLRLFTSVEVLDGDNTVRCHRCWKIANGFYKPRVRRSAQEPDSCSDSEDEEMADTKTNGVPSANSASIIAPSISVSPSQSTTSLQDTHTSSDTPSRRARTRGSSTLKPIPPALQLNDGYPIELISPVRDETPTQNELVVPSRSTTVPASPMSVHTARPPPMRDDTISSNRTRMSVATEHSSTSLNAPSDQHRQHGDSNTESEVSGSESETLLSVYSDVSSVASLSHPSPNASQDHLQKPAPDTHSQDKRHPSGVPRSRQFMLRPAYKRYLIATPPPILVVHLKRFQQLSKMPVVSFSTGFKKLDDYIAFPEYLDLAPYLAPRREDYFDSKVAVTRGRAKKPMPCMYRLYAVVVHIGNMLGGHYVAYTAIPPSSSEAEQARPENEKHRSDHSSEPPRDWAFISDTVVRLTTLEEVLKSKAYICMYERI